MKPGHWARFEIRNKSRKVGDISFNVCCPCCVNTDISMKQSVCTQRFIMVIEKAFLNYHNEVLHID